MAEHQEPEEEHIDPRDYQPTVHTEESLEALERQHANTPPNPSGFARVKARLDSIHAMGLSSKWSHVTNVLAASYEHGMGDTGHGLSEGQIIAAAEEERDRREKYNPDSDSYIGRNVRDRRPGQAKFPKEEDAREDARRIQDSKNIVSNHLSTIDSVNPDPTYDEVIKNVTNFDDKLKLSMGNANHTNYLNANGIEPHPMRPHKEDDGFYYCSSCKGLSH